MDVSLVLLFALNHGRVNGESLYRANRIRLFIRYRNDNHNMYIQAV